MGRVKRQYGQTEVIAREVTKQKVIEMAREFATKEEIFAEIRRRHKYMENKPLAVETLFREALAEFINKDDFRDYKGLNSARLDEIIKRCCERSRFGDAVKAIAEQNKILGNYEAELIKLETVRAVF